MSDKDPNAVFCQFGFFILKISNTQKVILTVKKLKNKKLMEKGKHRKEYLNKHTLKYS